MVGAPQPWLTQQRHPAEDSQLKVTLRLFCLILENDASTGAIDYGKLKDAILNLYKILEDQSIRLISESFSRRPPSTDFGSAKSGHVLAEAID